MEHDCANIMEGVCDFATVSTLYGNGTNWEKSKVDGTMNQLAEIATALTTTKWMWEYRLWMDCKFLRTCLISHLVLRHHSEEVKVLAYHHGCNRLNNSIHYLNFFNNYRLCTLLIHV